MRPKYPVFAMSPISVALVLSFAVSTFSAHAVDITGDTVTSDLTVEGGAITINDGGQNGSLQLRYDSASNITSFWQAALGEWVWSHGASPTDVMSLDQNHVLSLYDLGSTSANPAITLDPGDPDAAPSVAPSIMIGGSEVLTVANSPGLMGGSFILRSLNNQGSEGSLLMEGVFGGAGAVPVEGQGTRMMWYPEKAAFRIGEVSGNQWDGWNIGDHSFATGYDTVAIGSRSFAAGESTSANGHASIAIGSWSAANGFAAISLGGGYANGDSSVVLGNGSADGYTAVALGNSWAGGDYSVAMGISSASGIAATSSGLASASGDYSVAMGDSGTSANGYTSIALGGYANASGDFSFAANGAYAEGYNSIALGNSHTGYGSYENFAFSGGIANQSYSIAGLHATANADLSVALATGQADGMSSIAVGGYDWQGHNWPGNHSVGDNSASLGGVGNQSLGFSSFASGFWTRAAAGYSVALGSLNLGQGTGGDAWVEDEPLFELGNGFALRSSQEPAATSRSNAVTVLKNGQTTLTNKAWKQRDTQSVSATADPSVSTTDSGGNALVVDGHTVLNGKVTIAIPQGDISMGAYQ